MAPLPSCRHHIVHVDLHGRSLLDESDSQHEAMALFFAQENPANPMERSANHFHLHAFVQIPKWPWRDC